MELCSVNCILPLLITNTYLGLLPRFILHSTVISNYRLMIKMQFLICKPI